MVGEKNRKNQETLTIALEKKSSTREALLIFDNYIKVLESY